MIRFGRPANLEFWTRVCLLLAAAACVVLEMVRIAYAVSFTRPYLIVTSGCEEECLFSIWKLTQGQPVYTDTNHIPFSASYYNWAFYGLYGAVTALGLKLLHLGDAWIPTLGRFLSLILALLNGLIFHRALRGFGGESWLARGPQSWAWTLLATLGPIIGYWSFTVRPDIGGLLLESAGFCAVLSYFGNKRFLLVLLAGALFYLAWSFKQTSVTLLAGGAAALLVRGEWRAFLTLCGAWWALTIATLALGGPAYRENLLLGQVHMPFSAASGLGFALKAEGKNPFFLPAILLAVVVLVRSFRTLPARPVEMALVFAMLFSFGFALVTSCKWGANDNYYIPAAWASMLWLGITLPQMRLAQAGLIAGALAIFGAIVLTPTNRSYNYDYRSSDAPYRAVADRLARLPGPVFADQPYLNLPWVQRFSPHFVLGYAYDGDRRAGVPCEQGGWAGLVDAGYFATIVVTHENEMPPSFREKYEQIDEDTDDDFHDFKFYRRKP